MKEMISMPTVYVIDDESEVLDSISTLLETWDLTVKCFISAEAFLKNYRPSESECLILDVLMPTMSGLDLQTVMLQHGISMPIIFISGHSGIPESARAFRAGAIHFLEKPFDYDQLKECISEALEKSHENRQAFICKRKASLLVQQLTDREREILLLIAQGHANKDISNKLNISTRTVEAHRIHIKEKTQASSLAELTTLVIHAQLN
jgi:FixJ family two-component response regulator